MSKTRIKHRERSSFAEKLHRFVETDSRQTANSKRGQRMVEVHIALSGYAEYLTAMVDEEAALVVAQASRNMANSLSLAIRGEPLDEDFAREMGGEDAEG